MLEIIKSGVKTKGCRLTRQVLISQGKRSYDVHKLISRQKSATLADKHKNLNIPKEHTCSTDLIFVQDCEKNISKFNVTFKLTMLIQGLESIMKSKVLPKHKVKQLNASALSNISKLYVKDHCLHMCSNTLNSNKGRRFVPLPCDRNVRPVSQLYRYYSTKSTDVKDDVDSWEMLVDYEKLNPMELRIHERHRDAVREGKLMYVDPLTGYQVMTRLAHLERGECCGNACRHCPYGQSKVMEEKNKKTFNSAFYV